MSVSLHCLSHTPVMNKVTLSSDVEAGVRAAIESAKNQVEDFKPDLIVFFGTDHFNCFYHDLMPPFCIGAEAQSVGDYGTQAGPLPVPTDDAVACAAHVLKADVDVALSHRMKVDHGFTQTLELLTGAIDRYPVIPIFVNAIARPLSPARRYRRLGDAIGSYLKAHHGHQNILIMGSGGISHDPPVPSLKGPPEMRERLLSGRDRTPQEQALHEQKVVKAALDFAAHDPIVGGGSLQALDPQWDQQILAWLRDGDFARLDGQTDEEISQGGGSGGHEIRSWIAAFACLQAFGLYEAEISYYQAIPEWLAGFAHMRASPMSITGKA